MTSRLLALTQQGSGSWMEVPAEVSRDILLTSASHFCAHSACRLVMYAIEALELLTV